MTVDAVRPPRPTQVTVAFWCQVAAALLLLGIAGVITVYAVHFDAEISRVAAMFPDTDPDEVSSERTGNVFATLLVGVPALLLAIGLAATAVPVRRGSNVARILLFVGGGLVLLVGALQFCGGFAFMPLLLLDSDSGGDIDMSYEDSKFIETLYSSADPFSDAGFLIAVLAALGAFVLVAATVLLVALPPAHRYFVPRTALPAMPGWQYYPGGSVVPVPYMICPDPSAHMRPAAAPAGPVEPVEPDDVPAPQ